VRCSVTTDEIDPRTGEEIGQTPLYVAGEKVGFVGIAGSTLTHKRTSVCTTAHPSVSHH
jgi:hypothetical protein